MQTPEQTNLDLDFLREQLDSGRLRTARLIVNSLHPGELARMLESLPRPQRAVVWGMVASELEGDVLVDLGEEIREDLIRGMPIEEIVIATGAMELDDLADLLGDLPETVTREVVQSLDKQDRERLATVLAYDKDSAGGLMNVDVVTVRPEVTLGVVQRYLKARGEIPDGTDSLFVVNRRNEYLGSLFLSRLLTGDDDALVATVMSTEGMPIPADMPATEVVWEFEARDLLSAPVIDEEQRLVGRITVDDVVDVLRDEAEHSIRSAAGLDEEDDLFAPVLRSSMRRALWLGINLLTAFLAASVVDVFQTTIDKVVLLAVLMPVVPSMGGVAGTQSLTIITRAMALGQVDRNNARGILRKELAVGLINGAAWALIVAIATYLWFGDWQLGGVIAAALIINLFIAALAGFAIPLLLKRLNIDPALAGGVVLTTVTDVVGYLSFLGLGALILL